MENKKTKILAVLCILLSIGFISTAFAYYNASSATVTNTFVAIDGGKLFDEGDETNDYNGSFILEETKYELNSAGIYESKNTKVKSNNYSVIPGATIPKDPTITIKNKSAIPTYLFLEVLDEGSNAYITYTLDTCWKLVSEAKGYHGGAVYVYQTETGDIKGTVINAVGDSGLTIGILKDNQITSLASIEETEAKTLTFYAYLAQTGLGSLATTYNTCFPATPKS